MTRSHFYRNSARRMLWRPELSHKHSPTRARRTLVPRPADWGHGLSVCIAAIARDRRIVLASDGMVSFMGGTFSSDGALVKGQELVNGRWAAAFAGDDVTRVFPILERSRAALAQRDSWSAQDVAECVTREYHAERMAFATERHLSVYGMDMMQFMSNGTTTFGDQGFAVLRERIEASDVGCTFLIHGFDDGGVAHLMVVDHPGVVQFMNSGYWAIGSGAYMALSRLSLRRQTQMTSLEETVYNVCEAKLAAERAHGVGSLTKVQVLDMGRHEAYLDDETFVSIMERAQHALRPEIPKRLLKAIATNYARQRAKWDAPPKPSKAKESAGPARRLTKRALQAQPPSPE